MISNADNPFQSPKGMEFIADGDEILFGGGVAYELLKNAGWLPPIIGGVGLLAIFRFVGTDFRHTIGLLGAATILLILSIGVVLMATIYSSKNAPLMINRRRVRGQITTNALKREMEVEWKEIVRYDFDREGYLNLEKNDGPTYSIYVGWYSPQEQRRLKAYCLEQLGKPAEDQYVTR